MDLTTWAGVQVKDGLVASLNQSALTNGIPSVCSRQSVPVALRLYKLEIMCYRGSFTHFHSLNQKHFYSESIAIDRTQALAFTFGT